jgi:glutamate dehydrogenase
VVKFAEITMAEAGIDITKAPFTLKITGGPNGDVAGNCLRILLSRCPGMKIRLILDGTAALFDPNGIDREGLGRIVLADDLDAFDPAALGENGYIIYRTGRRTEGLKQTHRKISRINGELVEEWLELDEFYREYNNLVFSVEADLFIPAGGRPETIDGQNWRGFLAAQGVPTARVIIEGANSFITPEARINLQKSGVTIMRDASANKCGVISSSYEIIANLLLTEREFLENKEIYVRDVLVILEKRAADEARLILRRRRESSGNLLCTEISDAISLEINSHYARLFTFFEAHPELRLKEPFRGAILNHLPNMLSASNVFRKRINTLPGKYLSAILAAEIASSLVYTGDRQDDFEEMIRRHLAQTGR